MLKLPSFISLGQNVTINLHRDCADEYELIDNVWTRQLRTASSQNSQTAIISTCNTRVHVLSGSLIHEKRKSWKEENTSHIFSSCKYLISLSHGSNSMHLGIDMFQTKYQSLQKHFMDLSECSYISKLTSFMFLWWIFVLLVILCDNLSTEFKIYIHVEILSTVHHFGTRRSYL